MDLVRKAREKGRLDMGNGPVDIIVIEMLKKLRIATIYELPKWFQRRFQGVSDASRSWNIVKLVFLRNTGSFTG